MKIICHLFLLLFLSSQLEAQKISPSVLHELDKNKIVPVLIELKEKADLSIINQSLEKNEKANQAFNLLKNTADRSQKNILNILLSRNIAFHSFFIVNLISTQINREVLDLLSKQVEIKSILLDESISLDKNIDPSAQVLNQRGPTITWGLSRIEADKVWDQNIKGQGVCIAGEDTGYKWDLEGIKEKYRGYHSGNTDHAYNWHDGIHGVSPLSSDSLNPCGYNLKSPCDDNGHGTHTMGTMVGSTSTDSYGVAPESNWIGCRNMERGNGALSTYIECFEFFLAPTDLDGLNPKPSLSPSSINNSWYCAREEGCDTSNFSIMEEVVDHLTQSGIVVVISAGNSGQACGNINAPAAIYQSGLVVGAFAINDTISYFSSSGPIYNYKEVRIKPDVVAPGSDVVSRVPSGDLVGWNGTSMAGPHVAGLVALVICANPALNGQVEKIKTIIKQSARNATANIDCLPFLNDAVPNHVYGYGKIMASEAVKLAILTRIDNHSKDIDFYVVPNPFQNEFQIVSSSLVNNEFTLLNAFGKLITKLPANTQFISMDAYPSGIYFLHNRKLNKTIKLIKA